MERKECPVTFLLSMESDTYRMLFKAQITVLHKKLKLRTIDDASIMCISISYICSLCR